VQLSCLFPARLGRLKRLVAAHSALIVGVIVGVAGGALAVRCALERFELRTSVS
jgi:hypothetical protein